MRCLELIEHILGGSLVHAVRRRRHPRSRPRLVDLLAVRPRCVHPAGRHVHQMRNSGVRTGSCHRAHCVDIDCPQIIAITHRLEGDGQVDDCICITHHRAQAIRGVGGRHVQRYPLLCRERGFSFRWTPRDPDNRIVRTIPCQRSQQGRTGISGCSDDDCSHLLPPVIAPSRSALVCVDRNRRDSRV